MKTLSPLPRFTTLVSPVTSCTPASCAAFAHGFDDPVQLVDEKAFFQNEGGRQVQRTCATHGEIIHRAIDGKSADVAARKEDGRHDERVGGEGQACAIDLEDGLVVELVQRRIGEGRKENLLDKLGGELSAAAMAKHNLFVLEDREGTRTEAAEKRPRSSGCGASIASSSPQAGCVMQRLHSKCDRALGCYRAPNGVHRRSTLRTRPRPKPSSLPADAADCTACRTPDSRAASCCPSGSRR